MNRLRKFPHFSYNLSSPAAMNYGCIMADGLVHHRIIDSGEFYKALGYTNNTNILPDEFIWERYTRDKASKSGQCLQIQIMVYLAKNSERFAQEFGNEYVSMLGQCELDKIDDSAHCVGCPMHPNSISLQSQAGI